MSIRASSYRQNRWWQQWVWALVALTFVGDATRAQAPSVLPPSYPSSSDPSDSSRRVSRPVVHPSAEPATAPQPHFTSMNASREAIYQAIQQEATLIERQVSLVRNIVRYAKPSIVHIEATKAADPGKGFASNRIEEAGAGVIVELFGKPYILTNRHVIYPASAQSIRIELDDGRLIRPTEIWTDPATDVAVMAVEPQELATARLGDSDQVEIGDFVLAVGSPFGLSHSVTYGIISAKGRRNLELGSKEIKIQDFFQTDAAINPGNSGGPLLNLHGEVIGINTAIASNSGGNEGIGFAIPINMARRVAEQLVTRGKLQRAYLGVQLENAFDIFTARRLGLSSTRGALVKKIIAGSPAQRAGLQVGDVIVEFNGTAIENDGHLVETVGLTPVGSRVDVLFYRDGALRRTTAVLDPIPDP
ncbi:MAG: serine protease [Pirellulaceae bacterium]|nr:MAG: serine protease [Pirellulaceae bacterium]